MNEHAYSIHRHGGRQLFSPWPRAASPTSHACESDVDRSDPLSSRCARTNRRMKAMDPHTIPASPRWLSWPGSMALILAMSIGAGARRT
jgi:hypothetical protein